MKNFSAKEYCNTQDCRACSVAEDVLYIELSTDKSTEKLNVSQSEELDDFNSLQNFHKAGEEENSASRYIGIYPAAEENLYKAEDNPNYNNVSEIRADEAVVYKESDKHLNCRKEYECYSIKRTLFHDSTPSISARRSGKISRLRLRIPFMQAIAVP